MAFRRIALLSTVLALLLLVALAVPAAAGGTTVGCAPHCGGDAPATLQSPGHPAPESCIRDASCGGGLALGLGMVAGIGLLASAVPAIGPALLNRRRFRLLTTTLLGRLPAGGVYRPPRLLLDV